MSPSEEVRVRAMTAEDIDAVMRLERSTDYAPHWARAEYLRCLEEPGDSALRRLALVVWSGERFAGFGVLRLLSAPDGGEAELESIVVAPEFRGQGIGAVLMAAVIEQARLRGAIRLDLEVRASNLAAIRLYRRAGLVEHRRRRGYYAAPVEDAVLMGAILGGKPASGSSLCKECK